MIMGKSVDFEFADYTTVSSSIENINVNNITAEKSNVTDANPQLYYWKEAKNRYFEKVKAVDKPALDDLLFIVNCLGVSLSNLFGRHYPGNEKGHTPPLLKLIDSYFPSQGIVLKDDDPIIYNHFAELNIFYCDATKHPDRSKESKIINLSKLKVEQFLETTRQIWLWFGKRKYGALLSDDALKEFKYQFTALS